jgi:O-acetyl-ADP-ribose deacetylase (regulator of RNase III)
LGLLPKEQLLGNTVSSRMEERFLSKIMRSDFVMAELHYLEGDATNPVGDGSKLIIHCVNDLGKWGKGFVVPLGQRYPVCRNQYLLRWGQFKLGEIQSVAVTNNITVINMFGQYGIYPQKGVQPIRYFAIKKCLKTVVNLAKDKNATIHCPRLGCGLAGGKWEIVEQILKEAFADNGIDVYVYDLK